MCIRQTTFSCFLYGWHCNVIGSYIDQWKITYDGETPSSISRGCLPDNSDDFVQSLDKYKNHQR